MNEKNERIPQKEKTLDKRLTNDDRLSFTICPNNDLQHNNTNANKRWANVYQSVKYYLEPYKTRGLESYKLYPDLSFPNPLGGGKFPRVHFHGYLKCNDIVSFLSVVSTHSFFIEIDTIKDFDVWERYCKKFVNKFPEYSRFIIDSKDKVAKDDAQVNNSILRFFELDSDSDAPKENKSEEKEHSSPTQATRKKHKKKRVE